MYKYPKTTSSLSIKDSSKIKICITSLTRTVLEYYLRTTLIEMAMKCAIQSSREARFLGDSKRSQIPSVRILYVMYKNLQ